MPSSLDSNQNTTELDRLLIALQIKTQIEAAAMLGVRQSTLSDCKRRGSTVTGSLLENALKLGIRLEWIKDSELPMKKDPVLGSRCEIGRYCLESCPALEAAQRVVSLISACGCLCKACKYKHDAVLESGCGEGRYKR